MPALGFCSPRETTEELAHRTCYIGRTVKSQVDMHIFRGAKGASSARTFDGCAAQPLSDHVKKVGVLDKILGPCRERALVSALTGSEKGQQIDHGHAVGLRDPLLVVLYFQLAIPERHHIGSHTLK